MTFVAVSLIFLLQSAGDVRFDNSGTPHAQQPFLFGLAQLHNFEYSSAIESFREAQAKDPGFAMAYWGEAMAYNHPVWFEQDREAALEALARLGPTPAAREAKAATEREKAYLRSVEILYGDGDKHARDLAYAEAMAELHARYPDDADAAAFHALALLGTAHEGRDFATYMKAAAVVEETFRAHPRHPGVLHYLIHCYDDPIHAPLGLRAARLYAGVAPAAAHAQHMTSHIFVAMGMWDDVVRANENASGVAARARARAGRPEYRCGHYNFWLLYGYLQEGPEHDAMTLLSSCRETALGLESPRPVLDPDNSPLHSFLQLRSRYLLDAEAWDGEAARWSIEVPDGYFPEQVTLAFIEGYGDAKRGDLDAARSELVRLEKARQGLAPLVERMKDDFGPAALSRADILEHELRAVIAIAEGREDEALRLLHAAVAIEESMPFMFGPPFVDKPSGELLGETLLRLGRKREAEAAFARASTRTPGRAAVLRGIEESR